MCFFLAGRDGIQEAGTYLYDPCTISFIRFAGVLLPSYSHSLTQILIIPGTENFALSIYVNFR